MKKNIILTEQQLSGLLGKILSVIMGKSSLDDLFSGLGKKTDTDLSGITDENFYKKLLTNLGAPTSKENLKFLYAWRQSEGKAGKYNPFNTTQKMPGTTNFNSVGVKNYSSIEDGMEATLKTLKNGRYNCIVNGLKNDIGAKTISTKCINDLQTWGTGDLVAKVVGSYEKGATPKPSSLTA
jgi:hypothetical protein